MIGMVVVVPVARAVWLSASSANGVMALGSSAASEWAGVVAAALWSDALLLGRDRGPALLPPLLTQVLGSSDLPRSTTFRAPLLRAGALFREVYEELYGKPD